MLYFSKNSYTFHFIIDSYLLFAMILLVDILVLWLTAVISFCVHFSGLLVGCVGLKLFLPGFPSFMHFAHEMYYFVSLWMRVPFFFHLWCFSKYFLQCWLDCCALFWFVLLLKWFCFFTELKRSVTNCSNLCW